MRKKLIEMAVLCPLVCWSVSCGDLAIDDAGSRCVVDPAEDVSDSGAFRDFAIVLSKAVSNDMILREFIKEEALERFDRDYDVFYPSVKDRQLQDGKTFKEHILGYSTVEELESIERRIPKLTILVPDWSWLGAFSINDWDAASDDIYVGYEQSCPKKEVYANGEKVMELDSGEVPGAPTIIVKNNERIRIISPATRSGDIEYAFSSPAFDGTADRIKTRGRAWYKDTINFEYEELDDFVPKSDIYPRLIEAYEEFERYPLESACQRDYVYYGMSHLNTDKGVLKDYICERFYRFRIDPNGYRTMSDQYNVESIKNDPKLHDTEDISGRKKANKFEKNLIDKIWSDGSFELKFDFFIAGADGGMVAPSISEPFSVAATALFTLKCVHKEYKKQTAVAKGEYIYKFNIEDLESRWVNIQGIELPSWDISRNANSLIVTIHEMDKATESTYAEEYTCNYSHNFSFTGNGSSDGTAGGVNIKTSFGVAGGNSVQTSKSCKVSTKITEDSDLLGKGQISYTRRIINEPMVKTINGQEVEGYSVKSTQIGNVFITLLPIDNRMKY